MTGLTVTEKEHWKERISRRIDKRIESICADNSGLMERINNAARKKALESLGLHVLHERLESLKKKEHAIAADRRRVVQAMYAKVLGISNDDVDCGERWAWETKIDEAISSRQSTHRNELLAKDAQGKEILRLEDEKERLTDIVWLATSGKQIRELWGKVTKLLREKPTPLERDALAISPTEEE